ncbi:hypothetical protein [Bradyrhizobium murdochi]|uniref:hypothetical protein n=1 Tax=Bradyrhizobium murdochi TaxID=1038859 RepID=UPI0012EB8E8D|nr:hypothetical protein [Bradyrhizobium murdochi]
MLGYYGHPNSVEQKSQMVAAGASLMITGEQNLAHLLGASSSGFRYGCIVHDAGMELFCPKEVLNQRYCVHVLQPTMITIES